MYFYLYLVVLQIQNDIYFLFFQTFHQNQYGNPGEERIVQYVCFLPKKHKSNTPSQQKKRLKYYEERRTTSHWPYPLNVNGLQPQTYGKADLLIDYTKIIKPNLDDLDEKVLNKIVNLVNQGDSVDSAAKKVAGIK